MNTVRLATSGVEKLDLADEFLSQQRRYKTGLFRFLLRS